MKNNIILFVVISGLLFFGCKSPEEKALALIHDHFFQTMPDFDSYESISIKIDSSFSIPFTNKDIMSFAKEHTLLDTINDTRPLMLSILPRFKTEYNTFMKERQDTIKIFQEMLNSCDCSFNGWVVCHKFRFKNEIGQAQVKNEYFFFDKDITQIVFILDPSDKDYAESCFMIGKIYLPSMEKGEMFLSMFQKILDMKKDL